MKKNGFTLVELLAVIIIITLLALITSTSITKLVSDAKTDLSNTQIELIKSAAQLWGADNLNKLPSPNQCSYITLQDLKNQALIDSNVLDPKDNKQIPNDLKIKITNTLNNHGKQIINYEVNPNSVSGCNWSYLCKYTTDNEGNEMVTCGTEKFYVIEKTSSEVAMLSQYNITLSTTNPVQDSSDISYPAKNTVPFSSNIYWSSDGYSPAGNSSYNYVYDSNSNLYPYIEAYKKVLERMGLNIIDAKLMSYEQATTLGCSITSGIYCSSAPDWMGLTTYWLGSATDDTVSGINKGGYFSFFLIENSNEFDDVFGIRPVITLSISDVG